MNLPERILTPEEIKDLFESVFVKIEQDGYQNPMVLAEQDDFKKAAWAYPGTFMKICKGEIDREKLDQLLNDRNKNKQ